MKNVITYLKALWSWSRTDRVRTLAIDAVSLPSFCRVNMLKLVSILVLVLTVGVGNVWGAETSFTFTPTSSSAGTTSGTVPDGVTCSYSNISSKKNQCEKNKSISFSTSGMSSLSITKIVVSLSKSKRGAGTSTIKIGNSKIGTQTSYTQNESSGTEHTFNNTNKATGDVSVSVSATTSSLYFWYVKVYYTPSCTTPPTIGTAQLKGPVTATTATVTCSSGISSLGSAGCSISSYGFVIGTSSNPEIGGSGVTQHEVGTKYTSTEVSFSKDLTGLTASTTYYVRPYATNGKGTAYGTQTSFTTSALPKYTVTLKDDDDTRTQASAGASVTLPVRAGCAGYTFAGWTKTWVADQTEWTTTAPTIIPAGSYTPTANENLYPVYTKTEGGSATYALVSDAASFTDGTYVVAGYASSTYYFMNGEVDAGTGLGVEETGLAAASVSDGSFAASSLPSGAIEIDVEDDGDPVGDNHYYFISYTSGGETYYMDDSGTKQSLTWTTNTTVYTYHPNFTQNAGTNGCVLLSGSGVKVSQNGSSKTSFIRNYASSGSYYNDIYFFKKKSGGSTTYYISVPNCCTALGTINGSVSLSTDGCGAGELKATWEMLATTGIASQTLKVYDENLNEVTAKRVTGLTASTSTQTVTISGLNPCKEYYVTVENVSSGGKYCAAGKPWESNVETTLGYTYTINKTNVSLKAGETEATNSCENFIAEYVADTGYDLPATITVTGASSYDWENGVLMINKVNVTGNVTVEITGAQSNYTITYDKGANGTGSISAGNKTHGVDFTLSSETFTRTGYTQDGWSTSDGGDKVYNLGGSYSDNAAITLYPHWTINNYKVSWSVNGSTWSSGVTVANNNADYNTTVSAPTAPTSSDCDGSKVFVGWTNAEYSDPSSAPTTLFTGTSPAITANTTFYAVFATNGGAGGIKDLTQSEISTFYSTTANRTYGSHTISSSDGDWSGVCAAGLNSTIYSVNIKNESVSSVMSHLESPEYGNITKVSITATHTSTKGDRTLYICSSAEASPAVNNLGTIAVAKDNTSAQEITLSSATDKIYIYCSDALQIRQITVTCGSLSNYTTTCCQQPTTQLSMTADKTELVKSGTVNFTLTGGNGQDITWSCRDEADNDCDDLLTSTSSGATLTISSPVAATKTYTVKAVQPEDDDDTEVVCGKTVTMDITVKAQWTITFQTTDAEGATEYSHTTVTDGDTYTFPDLSDDYTCETNYSFAGWKAVNSDGAPEYAAGSSATASADKIWYAVWMYSTRTTTETRDKYELVTSSPAAIAEDDVVVIACNSQGVALAQMTASDTYGSPVAVDFATDKSYLTFASGTNVMELKVLNYADEGADSYYFVDNANTGNAITIANSSPTGKLHYSTNTKFWTWKITITVQNNATIEDYVNREYAIEYNSSNNRFAYYKKTQKKVQLYRKNGKVSVEVPATPTYSVNNTHCTNGATIRANGGQWITSAKDQKVRITVPVTAKNFATSSKQLTASSDNSHFSVSFPSHTIPSDKSEVEVQMTVEYTPEDANVIEEANITITTGTGDGNATKVIYVNGRSLPDEFVIVTQKEGKWQALPANMFSGTGTYSPMEVTPNGGITAIPAAPYTTIYSAREVASGRYESAGTCMRLVGNNNKCLWANSSSNGTGIQNFAALGNTNGAQYEWLLSTADGEQYTIANPAHPDYATGRQLGIYTLKYGLYKTTDIFYLLPVGCSSQPGNLQITPRRVDAMFSWETNAASVTIDLWTNEAMSTGHKQAVVTSVPYQFTGLTENTDYWYKITPGRDDDCAVTGTFSTTGPTIDVVEWGENSATIFVDKDEAVDPQIIIAGEVEHGQGGAVAKDIFFSKYFEAEGTAKMLAIYNGTGNAISLADITILHRSTTKNYTPLSLASYGKTAGWIQPGEEIILFNRDNRAAVMSCAESDPTYPSWNNVENTNLAFSGKGTIRLFRGNECIDIIGAMAAGDDINNKAVTPIEGSGRPSFGDANGFVSTSGDDYATKETVENDYELSTNRCLLIRQNWVTSGDSAVLNNFDDFKTLGTYTGVDSKTHKGEWAGLQVPDAVAPEADYIHTCEGFQEVGKFDYNQYYREYTQIGEDKYLSEFTRAEDGTYTLSIGNMRKYACLNLKFQLTEHDNKANVLTEQTVQVPIVVVDSRNSNDALFNNVVKDDNDVPMVPQSIERCKTCNVVVLSTGTLTKATDGTTNDVAEVRDVKVYPGGKLIVPEGTHYVINSLSLRRQEDEIASAKIDAGLSSDPSDVSKKGLYIRESNGVYLDVRIDPSNWHYFTLPYDCRVGDIRFSDGTPAKVNNDYLISWYDGAYRAEHKDGGWTDITEEDYVLKKGLGYIVALPGEGLIKRELRFPMANEVISAELANKEVGGLYAYGGDKTDEELRPNHKGWNMIGNPYLYDYTKDIVKSPLATGELIHDPSSPWNGQWVRTGDARYIVEPIDNGWTGYRQTTISNLKPFTSYFIQIGTTTDGKDNPETERNITFTKTSKASIARRNMPAAEAEEPMYPVWYGIEMTAPNAEKDNTTLLISDEFTDGYDMMDDLIKMRGSYYQYYPYPVLASRNNEGEMAFNALPDSSASVIGVPLNYYAAQAGTYTIRTDSRFDLEEVKSAMLYDATTNQYNDLLAGDYSFTTAKGDNTNRFKLFVRVERKKAPEVATGTDNILENGKLSLIAIDRTLVLSGLDEAADIYVYDMSGKLMNSDHASGSGGIWRANVSAQGIYFVRVNSQSGRQTLRTIVK